MKVFILPYSKFQNNKVILPHTAILESVCAAIIITESMVTATLKAVQTCNSIGKQMFSQQAPLQ
jgi:hypothetical protein